MIIGGFIMEKKAKIAIVMGSDSDLNIMMPCIEVLKKFGVEYEVMVCSAHRTPEKAADFAKKAESNGFDVIIAAAGKAAHLPGVLAAFTVLPVIGVPIKSSALDGLDALLAIVQMPSGIPVATVAIDGSENAGLLAVQIASGKYQYLREAFYAHKKSMEEKVDEKNNKLQSKLKSL